MFRVTHATSSGNVPAHSERTPSRTVPDTAGVATSGHGPEALPAEVVPGIAFPGPPRFDTIGP